VNPDDVRRKLAVLREHCAALGRAEEGILPSHIELPLVLAGRRVALEKKLAGTPEEEIAYYRALVEAGMRYFIAGIGPSDRETLELLGREVLPAFADP
jgi:hypothetical protein